MARNEGKAKSARRALRDVSNKTSNSNVCGGEIGRFSKSIKKKQIEKQQQPGEKREGEEEDYLDRLLLVQSDLSTLTRQIDELVAQAFKVKATNKQGTRQIFESFSHLLSDMLSSLKPWVPRFQKALCSPAAESGNQLVQCLADRTVSAVNDDEKLEIGSPEQTGINSLISPSPFVSWRAECNIERNRQLFLLTPLPISRTLSSKHVNLSKPAFEGITSNHTAVEIPSFLTFSEDVNDDLLEGIATKPTPNKPPDVVVTEATKSHDSQFASSPAFTTRDHSVLVMTPCLKMSPPKSCALLEPFSESSHKGKSMARKSTPFPAGMLSQISEFSESEGSEDLALKYPELLGIQRACKSKIGKKELEASPSWFFSPPKTCVLLELPDEKLQDTVANGDLPVGASDLNQQTNLSVSKEGNDQGGCHQIQKPGNRGPIGDSLILVESTPMWEEPESKVRTGKRPGENTLKKELWTKFEAASSYGLRLNVSSLQLTAQKGFLDLLDEVSCDGESPVTDSVR